MAVSLQHHLNQLRRRMEKSGLDHDGSLARILASINTSTPNAGDIAALRAAEERLRLQELNAAHGFLPLPSGILNGPYNIAFDANNGTAVRPTRAHLARTTTISGATGSGKTTLLHRIVRAALRDGVNVWTIDVKNDAQYLAIEDERTLIIDSDAPLNLLQRPPFLSAAEHQAIFTTVFARSFYGGEHLKQIITRGFEALGPNDNLEDLARHVDQSAAKNGTYAERDATRGGLLRLHRIGQLYPGLYRTRHGLRLEELFNRSMYLPVKIQTEIDEFIFAYLIHLLFLYQRSRAARPELSHLIQMDEGILSWTRSANTKIEGVPLLSYLQSMVREFGIGMLISTTSVHLLDLLLKSNTFTRIALNVTDHLESSEIARSFGLSDRQREYFQRGMTRGECIIKLADDWTHPILATYPRNTDSKIVSPSAWEAARQRTHALVPPPPPPVVLTAAAREGIKRQPVTPKPPRSASHAVAAPLIKTKIALNTHAERLLVYCAQHGVIITTEAFRQLELHPQAGTRAKKQLLDLALIEEERTTIRRGRGGTAVVIRPTRSGYERAGVKRHGTRGGDSIAHEYLVRAIANRILGAKIDVTVGTKAVDVLIAYNDQAGLARIIGTAPPRGALIAIEVEVSSPDKTAPLNIERNRAAGISHTIIATMTPLRRTPSGVIVLGVFDLMEAL